MRIVTWNVNSLKARLPHVIDYLKASSPDVLCLQELKMVDEAFPKEAIEELGYNCAVHGQKTYNGVALLSKRPMEDIRIGLPGDKDDEQSRYIEALVVGDEIPVRVASIYLPNGNPAPGPKYDYKLKWMDRLTKHAKKLLALEEPLVLAGDYNVIPTEDDVWDAKKWTEDALYLLETREKFRELTYLGFTDAYRACSPEPHRYSFWDYQGGAWPKDHGIRIDHLMLSAQAADLLTAADIDRTPRSWERPSDHTTVWCDLAA